MRSWTLNSILRAPQNRNSISFKLDDDGLAVASCDWIWVKQREFRGCIGCHEDPELTPPVTVQANPASKTAEKPVFETPIADQYRVAANKIIDAALADGDAYKKLSYLTDRIGARLSGSRALGSATLMAPVLASMLKAPPLLPAVIA